MATARFQHIRGLRAAATVVVGGSVAAISATLLPRAFSANADAPVFVALAGLLGIGLGLAAATLPWRVVSEADEKELRFGWMFGKRTVPWEVVRAVCIGPLGTGAARDPAGVTILLHTGEEILFTTLSRKPWEKHREAKAFIDFVQELGIPVENLLAPPEERDERERLWREARMKGHR